MTNLAATLPPGLRAMTLNAAEPPPTDPGKTGLTPGILGDPVVALIGQLNRYRKANKVAELPLWPGPVTPALANEALGILRSRLEAANALLPDPNTAKQLAAIKQLIGAPLDVTRMAYVSANLAQITQQLALNANRLGLDPAKVGITAATDPTAKQPVPMWVWIAAGAVIVVGGGAYWYMRQRAQTAPAG